MRERVAEEVERVERRPAPTLAQTCERRARRGARLEDRLAVEDLNLPGREHAASAHRGEVVHDDERGAAATRRSRVGVEIGLAEALVPWDEPGQRSHPQRDAARAAPGRPPAVALDGPLEQRARLPRPGRGGGEGLRARRRAPRARVAHGRSAPCSAGRPPRATSRRHDIIRPGSGRRSGRSLWSGLPRRAPRLSCNRAHPVASEQLQISSSPEAFVVMVMSPEDHQARSVARHFHRRISSRSGSARGGARGRRRHAKPAAPAAGAAKIDWEAA